MGQIRSGRALEMDDEHGIDDVIDFEGDVRVDDEGVELVVGRVVTLLAFPFRLADLFALAEELQLEQSEL